MDIRPISKAIAGGIAAGLGGAVTPALIIPADVPTPWWGYILASVVSAAIGFAGVWIAPANKTPGP